MPADITHARTLLRMPQDLKARVVADAERQNLSESEWWRRAAEAVLSSPTIARAAARQQTVAPVATSEGGSRVSPEQEKGASLAPTSPRARTAPPAAGPTASTPRAKPSRAAKAGVRPQPKQGKR